MLNHHEQRIMLLKQKGNQQVMRFLCAISTPLFCGRKSEDFIILLFIALVSILKKWLFFLSAIIYFCILDSNSTAFLYEYEKYFKRTCMKYSDTLHIRIWYIIMRFQMTVFVISLKERSPTCGREVLFSKFVDGRYWVRTQ